jgi:hypothetical protein
MGGESSREWRIPASEFEIARASLHWVDEVWLEDNSANAIPYLSRDAAAHFVNGLASELAGKVNEFSERAEQWTQLAALAVLYQLPEASGWIRRAADCLIGYGNRKDLTAMEVLDAIEAVHAADPSHSERWVRSLVPVIDQITSFTDGDETDHVRSDLIDTVALTMPKQLPALFRHHHAADEFRYADECLQAAIKFLEFGSRQSRALAHTIIDPLLLYELDRRGKNDSKARALWEQQLEFLGGEPLAKADRDYSTPDPPERKPKRKINPARYRPAKLATLISDMNAADVSYKRKPELLRQWLHHWLSRGRAVEALNALELYLQSNDSGLEVEDILDHAFEVSLTAQGKDAAYGWLVRAHIHRNGWSRFWAGNEEVLNRLSTAATHYADRWRDYILDTSEQSQWRRRRGLWFAIGRQYLVRYLLLVGQVGLAIQVTDTLVQIFLAEVRDQPIGDSKWFA